MCLNLAFSAGCFACQACAQCCGATVGKSFKQQVRLAYVMFDAIFVGIAILLLYYLSKWLQPFALFISCPAGNEGLSCLGVSAIFRMSFALVALHVFILIFLFMRNGCSRSTNEDIWMFKIMLVVGVFIGSFFISNDFFAKYSVLAMYVSIVFILFQIVMIIDLCYLWNKAWIERYDAGENCYGYLLVFLTAGIYGFLLYFNYRSYQLFDNCHNGTLAVTVNLILTIISSVLIVLRLHPDGSIFTSGMVGLYTTYWVWSGMTSVDDSCNVWTTDESTINIQLIVNIICIIISLFYVSLSAQQNTSGKVELASNLMADAEDNEKDDDYEDEENGNRNRNRGEKKNKKMRSQQQQDDEEEERPVRGRLADYRTNTHINFHLIMLAAAFYISMLLSNWGNPYIDNKNVVVFAANSTASWVKIGTAWFTQVLYIWTIIAPRLFPDRDFS